MCCNAKPHACAFCGVAAAHAAFVPCFAASFDGAVKDCQAVFHTASPFYVKGIDDYERQLIEPAVSKCSSSHDDCHCNSVLQPKQ